MKGQGELKEDGTLHSSTQYLKNGVWVDGHRLVFREAPDAKLIFK